jgi:hypothetical protein
VRVTKAPLKVNPALLRGFEAFNRGDLALAQLEYERAQKSDPRNTDALHGLAAIAVRQGRHDQADLAVPSDTEADPQDTVAIAALINNRGKIDPGRCRKPVEDRFPRHSPTSPHRISRWAISTPATAAGTRPSRPTSGPTTRSRTIPTFFTTSPSASSICARTSLPRSTTARPSPPRRTSRPDSTKPRLPHGWPDSAALNGRIARARLPRDVRNSTLQAGFAKGHRGDVAKPVAPANLRFHCRKACPCGQMRDNDARMNSPPSRRPIGQILITQGVISEDQLRIALLEQMKSNQPVGKLLVSLGFVSEATLRDALGESLGQKASTWRIRSSMPEALRLVPRDLAKRHMFLALSYSQPSSACGSPSPTPTTSSRWTSCAR